MRISDWSSDVCSSDLSRCANRDWPVHCQRMQGRAGRDCLPRPCAWPQAPCRDSGQRQASWSRRPSSQCAGRRSEEHTSELQSLMRISYAVFCLKKKKKKTKSKTKHYNDSKCKAISKKKTTEDII